MVQWCWLTTAPWGGQKSPEANASGVQIVFPVRVVGRGHDTQSVVDAEIADSKNCTAYGFLRSSCGVMAIMAHDAMGRWRETSSECVPSAGGRLGDARAAWPQRRFGECIVDVEMVLKQPLLGSRGRGDGCTPMLLRQPLLARRGRRDAVEAV